MTWRDSFKANLKDNFTTRNVFTAMAIVMWGTSFIADLTNPTYDPPPYVNPLILLVAGYLFAIKNDDKPAKKDLPEEKEKK